FDGELSESELADLKAKMDKDSNLKARVEEYRNMVKGIKSYERNELSKIISGVADNNQSDNDTNNRSIIFLALNQETKNNSRLPV
ncbi:hypothetical protein, partial [Enterococcus lactis]|uniref:hypothetical protein n=1 Tax=Enterococcus lactis TaxID=357441 RepID=UPI002362314A